MNVAPSFHLDRRPGLLSLCSGTGMLDLGVKLAFEHVFGILPRVLGFAEREAFAASLLMARMEEKSLEQAPVFCGDFRDLDARPMRGHCDLLATGLPCQPYSTAGQQRGLSDARSWGAGNGPLPHALRIIEESQPALVCFENVPQWVTGGAFRKFGEALCALGYEISDPLFIRASDVGAAHRRERVFILAHLPGERSARYLSARQGLYRQRAADTERTSQGMADAVLQYWAQHGCAAPQPRWTGAGMADADGNGCLQCGRSRLCHSAPQREVMADTSSPGLPHSEQCGECGECGEPGQQDHAQSTAEFHCALLADAHGKRLLRGSQFTGEFGETNGAALGYPAAELHRLLFAPGPDDASWTEVIKCWAHLSPSLESGVRVLVDGLAMALDESRPDQLRAGGNGVVALQAAAAFTYLFRQLK